MNLWQASINIMKGVTFPGPAYRGGIYRKIFSKPKFWIPYFIIGQIISWGYFGIRSAPKTLPPTPPYSNLTVFAGRYYQLIRYKQSYNGFTNGNVLLKLRCDLVSDRTAEICLPYAKAQSLHGIDLIIRYWKPNGFDSVLMDIQDKSGNIHPVRYMDQVKSMDFNRKYLRSRMTLGLEVIATVFGVIFFLAFAPHTYRNFKL